MAEKLKADGEAKPGHNGFNPDQAKSFISRIEEIEEQKKGLAEDIKEIKLEASEAGIPTKVLNEVLRERKKRAKMEQDEWEAYENGVDQLKHALGMLSDTPLGEAALAAAE